MDELAHLILREDREAGQAAGDAVPEGLKPLDPAFGRVARDDRGVDLRVVEQDATQSGSMSAPASASITPA